MTASKRNSKIFIVAGIVSLIIGVLVFAVRLNHDGAYAMPHGGPLYGALGALFVAGILLWSGKPRVVGWIALVVSPLALFPAIYGIVGELEEVVSLYAVDADGKTTDLRLWIVDRDDGAWVGMSRDKATEFSLNGARLDMLRAGEIQCVVPMLSEDQPTTNEIHAMKVDKYAAARGAAVLGMYPLEATPNTAALRLDPC